MRIEIDTYGEVILNGGIAIKIAREQVKGNLDGNEDVIVFPNSLKKITNNFAKVFNNEMIRMTGSKDPYNEIDIEADTRVMNRLYSELYGRDEEEEIKKNKR